MSLPIRLVCCSRCLGDARAANANHQARIAELRQLSSKFEATVAALNAEVEIAVREVETTFQELQAKRELVVAAQADTTYLHKRGNRSRR